MVTANGAGLKKLGFENQFRSTGRRTKITKTKLRTYCRLRHYMRSLMAQPG